MAVAAAAAAVLLVVFLAIGVMMILTADTTDAVWKNRIAIFSAFQALVFGAVGWLFGREVNRVPAEVARVEAQEAKDQAQENAEEAAEARVRAAMEETRGRALASAVTATAASTSGERATGDRRLRTTASSAPSAQMAALAAMAEDLYGTAEPARPPPDRPARRRDDGGCGRGPDSPCRTEADAQAGRDHRRAQPYGRRRERPAEQHPADGRGHRHHAR